MMLAKDLSVTFGLIFAPFLFFAGIVLVCVEALSLAICTIYWGIGFIFVAGIIFKVSWYLKKKWNIEILP